MGVAGGDGVDIDVVGTPLPGEALGEPVQARLGHVVGGEGGDIAHLAGVGGDVDDLAFALLPHDLAHQVAEAEGAVEVHVDAVEPLLEVLPILQDIAHGSHAAVVHQDIHGAEIGHHRVDAGLAVVIVGDVGLVPLVGAAQGGQLLQRFLRAVLAAAEDGDVGALLRHGGSDAEADAGVAAGDDGDLVLQAECVFHGIDHGIFSFR